MSRSRKPRPPRTSTPVDDLFASASASPAGSTSRSASAAAVSAPPPSRNWTPEQRAGIETTGRSLLVSAAAGSGKTAVLSERCARLVCEADPPCDVDELLVVTFTEAAAAEMKSRIQQSLANRMAVAESPRLARQLALIDHAQVSTLHGFCARLLRQNFHLLGLDPNFTILDGDEAALLRVETARQLFAERYENDATGAFQSLIDAYGDGDDERLIQKVVATHELLGSLVDPHGWRTTAIARLEEAATGDFAACEMGRELKDLIGQRIAALLQNCDDTTRLLDRLDGFDKYRQPLDELKALLGHMAELLEAHGIDALIEVLPEKFKNLPAIPQDTPGKAVAKGRLDDIRNELKKDGALFALIRWNTAQWIDGCRATLPHAKVFLELVDSFGQRYRQEKTAAHSVDFTDLERLALNALLLRVDGGRLVPTPLARAHHRRFKHVLVDEYQDINEVQDAILSLVSRECICEDSAADASQPSSNLFCVGDVKQSIYRFRLAEPTRFLERHRRFRDPASRTGTVIDLQANFRSRGPLLEALNGVFARLMTEEAAEITYDQSHHLRPGAVFPDGNGNPHFDGAPVELHLLPKDPPESSEDPNNGHADTGDADDDAPDRTALEAVFVAQRIRELMGAGDQPRMHVADKAADGSPMLRPIEYRDIVILLRSLKYKADQFAEVLRLSGIPVHSESGTGYFESMEVRDMLALLAVLDNQRQDVPLAAVLRSPLANLPEPDTSLARIRLAYGGREPVPFHQAVVRYAHEKRDELAAKLRDFLSVLGHWRELARRRPLAELIWTVYDRTGYLAFCAALPDGEQRSANLLYLHERARQFGTFQRQGLARFLTFLQQLQDESDLGQPSVATAAENVVRVMSVHRSKGLEFPVVILPDLGKRINLSDCSGSILTDRRGYLGMWVVDEAKRVRYPSLGSVLAAARLRRQSLAEELRVLYVAMTRAKEHLILLGTAAADAADKWQERWSDHDGPLPADAVLGASSMLDWIGPVATAMQQDRNPGFASTSHTQEEIASWPNPDEPRPGLSPMQHGLARMESLDPVPPPHPDAQRIIQRLISPYAHQSFTTVSATIAATELSKHGRQTTAGWTGPSAAAVTFDRLLASPRAAVTDLTPTATDIGSATHLVLQHIDFSRPCDAAGLKEQIDRLLKKRLITPASAELVDLPAIEWFAATQLGQTLRAHASRLRREWPVYYARRASDVVPGAPPSDAPLDQVMIRSRVDVLLETPGGLEIIDYKTDRVGGDAVAERAEFYRPQMELYRDAIAAIVGTPLRAAHLVFLVPRVIVTN